MDKNPRQVNNKLKLLFILDFAEDDLTVLHFQNKRMQNSISKIDWHGWGRGGRGGGGGYATLSGELYDTISEFYYKLPTVSFNL